MAEYKEKVVAMDGYTIRIAAIRSPPELPGQDPIKFRFDILQDVAKHKTPRAVAAEIIVPE